MLILQIFQNKHNYKHNFHDYKVNNQIVSIIFLLSGKILHFSVSIGVILSKATIQNKILLSESLETYRKLNRIGQCDIKPADFFKEELFENKMIIAEFST